MLITVATVASGCGTGQSPAASAGSTANARVVGQSGSEVQGDGVAQAQGAGQVDSREVEHYPAMALSHIADSLAGTRSTGHLIRSHPTYQYLQIRRGSSGGPEVHDRWADVAYVQSGRASLLTGGRVDGSHLESPGEHRGGTIVGGTSRALGPGDLVIIPAGIPHQYRIAPGDSLRYLTVKVLDTIPSPRR